MLVWGMVVLLYSLHLSYVLIFKTSLIFHVALWIVIPFVATLIVCIGFRTVLFSQSFRNQHIMSFTPDELAAVDRLIWRAFGVWIVLTLVEIAVSGGLPIIWLIQGSNKTYFDFGIPSVHGFLNSLLLALGVCQIALFAIEKKKKHLLIPTFVVVWSVIVVTRNMMMVMIIEGAIAWALLRGFSWKKVVKALIALVMLVLIFGYVGDFRSGGDAFRKLAQPTNEYPVWLPSGALWVYIYLTTPVGNVVNTVLFEPPANDPLFPNTTSLLFPSVARKIIYGEGALSEALSGNLVTDAFNVSTAYIGPFQDFGYLGIVCFSVLLAMVSYLVWSQCGLRGVGAYAVIGQCVILSVFFNHLFYLPVITQLPWIYLFLPGIDPPSMDQIQ